MDLWVVAAAAGAGYIAKNLQNLSSVDKKESQIGPCYKYSPNIQPEAGSTNFLQQLREITCPLRRLARNNDIAEVDVSEVHRSSDRADDDSEDYNTGLLASGLPKEESLHFSEDAQNRNIRRASISTIEPLLVTDTTRGIYTSVLMRSSVSSLEQIEKLRKSKECSESSQGPSTMLLLITGMTVGILSATMSWKTEVDKLNKQLKQMQSLVKDLHEELDMKEMIMVKELSTEGDAAENESVQEPISSPSGAEANNDKPGKIDRMISGNDNIYTENLELLSKIEAELQAELEMLENNMNASSLERISSVVELDRDFDSGNEKTEDGDDTATNQSQLAANYVVSPWELSLRLHDLIESRLQNRVYELERALANTSSYSSPNESKYSDAESLS